MSTIINFGIDLGTTNSLIAKYNAGKVEVFKNIIGQKETLPSVVAFRKDRILVGDKAREYIEKDSDNVFSSFKRKMGTNETFTVKSLNKTITPINLSAIVLKELKNFVYTNEIFNAIVITIPASFDTVQSIATQKAGFEAGFKEVVLLQEPIAASLAYANAKEVGSFSGKWLVYDLGGGTFDVALVKTEDEQMRVLDHEGNNFLGGLDFDNIIVDSIITPNIKSRGSFSNLENELKSQSGKYNRLYYVLLHKAEEAKVLLSVAEQTEIEFEIEDDNGDELEIVLTITRSQFEDCIKPFIDSTIEMINTMLSRNGLSNGEIAHVLLVGGSTYIPYVRNRIKNDLAIPVDYSIDPSTAIVVGAAYYAGTKKQTFIEETAPVHAETQKMIGVRMAYQKTTHDVEEYFIAEFSENVDAFSYRIIRDDGGFDTGLKKASSRITEMLPLLRNSFNTFTLKLVDAQNNNKQLDNANISILHGKFSIVGQPLPNDICIEIDDFEKNTTRLEVIFEKNAILPIKKTITRSISKTIEKDSSDSVIINIVEGDRFSNPLSNQPIGTIEISGKAIERTLVKGSDVEITVEISESRELKVTSYLLMTDQEFSSTFRPSERQVNINKLKDDIVALSMLAKKELETLQRLEKYEEASKVKTIVDDLQLLHQKVRELTMDDVSAARYQLEDTFRRLSRKFDLISVDTHIVQIKFLYFESKSSCEYRVKQGTPENKQAFDAILSREKAVLASNSIRAITHLTEELDTLRWEIARKDPMTIIALYHHYAGLDIEKYTDVNKAKAFIATGERALERKNYDEVLTVIYQLYNLLPADKKDDAITRLGIS